MLFLLHEVIAPLLGMSTLVASAYLTLTRLRLVPILLVGVMPLFTLKWSAIVDLPLSTMVVFGFLLGLFLRTLAFPGTEKRLFLNKWLAMWGTLMVLSAILGYLSLPDIEINGASFFRGSQGRTLTQVISLFIRVSLLQLAVVSITNMEVARNVFRMMLITGALLLVAGAYEYIAFVAGLPWIGIVRADPSLSGYISGLNLSGGQFIVRLASLAGEPKILAQSIAPLIILIIITRMQNRSLGKFLTSRLFLIGLFWLFFATYSVSGWLGFIVGLLGVVFLIIRRERHAIRAVYAILATGMVLVVGITLTAGTSFLPEIFFLRILGPFQDMLSIIRGNEPALLGVSVAPELAALKVLVERPTRIWFGVGAGNGHFYIAPIINHPLDSIASINSGITRELLEWGVLGVAAFYALHLSVIKSALVLRRRIHSSSELRWYLNVALAIEVTSLALDILYSSEITGQLWLYLGILIALTRIARFQLDRESPLAYGQQQCDTVFQIKRVRNRQAILR